MTKAKFVPGRGYTKKDWDAVTSPALTAEQLAQARPFAEVFPELAASMKSSRGRPAIDTPLQQISVRLDPGVVAIHRRQKKNWIGRVLRNRLIQERANTLFRQDHPDAREILDIEFADRGQHGNTVLAAPLDQRDAYYADAERQLVDEGILRRE